MCGQLNLICFVSNLKTLVLTWRFKFIDKFVWDDYLFRPWMDRLERSMHWSLKNDNEISSYKYFRLDRRFWKILHLNQHILKFFLKYFSSENVVKYIELIVKILKTENSIGFELNFMCLLVMAFECLFGLNLWSFCTGFILQLAYESDTEICHVDFD